MRKPFEVRDLIGRMHATKNRWGAQQAFEHVARIEAKNRARRNLSVASAGAGEHSSLQHRHPDTALREQEVVAVLT